MVAQHRYNAACAAALAGIGQGENNPSLVEPGRMKLRRQALEWLKADYQTWAELFETSHPMWTWIPSTLRHWKADPDLVAVRDPEYLAKLPEEEQKEWQNLWVNVDALLAKVVGRVNEARMNHR
jgi:hypothetical protein